MRNAAHLINIIIVVEIVAVVVVDVSETPYGAMIAGFDAGGS